MSSRDEYPITARISERPTFSLRKLRDVPARGLLIRFVAGAITSIVAGTVTLVFNARVGGVMLAFPAILAASLTLIAREEDRAQAREDARGAVAGALALAVFAGIAALAFGALPAAIVLALATIGWFLAALAGYFGAWFR